MKATPRHAQPCRVEACDRLVGKHGAHGLCAGHYLRLQAHGEPGTEPIKEYDPTRLCGVAGCGKRAKARGWCTGHYMRWATTGATGGPLAPRAPQSGTKPYSAAHQRLHAARGSAADHECRHCGGPAAHWAYDHADPDEVAHDRLVFSFDPEHYIPLCVPCHSRFDREWRSSLSVGG